MDWQEAEAQHPGVLMWARDSFVDNECGSDEYGETQPAKGFGYIFEYLERGGRNYPDAEFLTDVARWVTALAAEPGARYGGSEELVPVLRRTFTDAILAGEHPYDQSPDETVEWYVQEMDEAAEEGRPIYAARHGQDPSAEPFDVDSHVWETEHEPGCPIIDQRASLLADLRLEPRNIYLQGAVPEYHGGGDQEADGCTCGAYKFAAAWRSE